MTLLSGSWRSRVGVSSALSGLVAVVVFSFAPSPVAASSAHALYYGGPVVSNIQMVETTWGAGTYEPEVTNGGFGNWMSAVTNSAYLDWLYEYVTNGLNGVDGQPGSHQHIGRGTYAGYFPITPSVGGTTIQDSQIQSELASHIADGTLPAPTFDFEGQTNTDYVVFFPHNDIIDLNGSQSGVDFCSYHSTAVYNGHLIYYTVMPDFTTGGMATGCGNQATEFENASVVLGGSTLSTITDSAAGQATSFGRPLAWYDPVAGHGEIGSICNRQAAALTLGGGTYYVQKGWSNLHGACIATSTTQPPDFTLSNDLTPQTVAPGGSVQYTVYVITQIPPAETVSLSVSGLPSGVTGSFSPATVTSGSTSTLTLTAASDAPTETGGSFTVVGDGTYALHTNGGYINVKPIPTVATTVVDDATNAAWSGTESSGASAHDTAAIGGVTVTPTGTVTFSHFTNATCAGTATTTQTVTVAADGSVPNSNSTGPLAAGSDAFQAAYSGDGNYQAATSACEPFSVSVAATTTAVASSSNPSAAGQSVTYTASVSPAPDAGTMAFTDNGVTLTGCGAVTVSTSTGTAPCTTSYSTVGSHSIVASYSGDSNYTASSGSLTQLVATTVQDSSPSASFDSWSGVVDAGASGGTYRSATAARSTVSFRFTGTTVTWLTRQGPDQGIAAVTIDGVSKGTFDLYAAAAGDQVPETFSGLTSARHKIVIKVTGTKNPASTGTAVAVDAFVAGSTTTQDSSTKVAYDTWTGAKSTSASGGTDRVSGKVNATCGLTFSGTSVQWITATGPAYGEAEVILDGVNQGTVDLYSASIHWQVAETYAGLAAGSHTIVIKVLGIKNPSSTGTRVVVDAFVIS